MDLIVESLQEVVHELGVPLQQGNAEESLLDATPEYPFTGMTGFTGKVVDVHSVELFDDGVSPVEHRNLIRASVVELQEFAGPAWRQDDGTPTHWLRGPGLDGPWGEAIRLYPTPNAQSAAEWPKFRVNVSTVPTTASAAGTISDYGSTTHWPALKIAMFRAMGEFESSQRRYDSSQFWLARAERELVKLKSMQSRERHDVIRVPYRELG